MNRQEFIAELEKIHLPKTEFVILSGGSLLLRGLREQTADLDLSVSKKLADEIRLYDCPRDEHGLFLPFENVQMKHDMERFHFDVIDGYQCESLEDILGQKYKWNRPKDRNDIKVIEAYLHKPVSCEELLAEDLQGIQKMAHMAAEIVRDYFEPIIGKAQNEYMIRKFQTEEAIAGQLASGCRYFFVTHKDRRIGFLAVVPGEHALYLSKFYLYKEERGKGYARSMLDFVTGFARAYALPSVELHVNRHNEARKVYETMGFYIVREEKNDIGEGFFMDDYVYRLDLS